MRGKRVLTSTFGFAFIAATAGMVGTPAAAKSAVHWNQCYRELAVEFGVRYECTTIGVPLDHDRPNGPTIQLALVRLPATDPAARIGSIFLNPGGPGGSGVDFALFFGPFAEVVWGPEVRARFDLVGFDPRGIGRSTAIRCFGNERQSVAVFPPFPFPLTSEEEAVVAAGDALLADQCDQRGSLVADHMSTANVARDLDLLRARLGDDQLTYFGGSYGSYLGVTYANLFPERVRSVVIDGILDPIAWSNVASDVPFSTALRSDEGAQETLDRFFALCDAATPGSCALAPGSAARFDALADRLRLAPIPVTDPETGEEFLVTYQILIGVTLGALYNPFGYADFAALVAFLEASAPPATIGAALNDLTASSGLINKRGFPHYQNFAEGFPAVACEDSDNPRDYSAWSQAGADADEQFGYFGRIWTWASSPCAQWPLRDEDRYTGPYDASTANPVLIVGNLYDPATRYEGAQTVRSLLPNSGLVTIDLTGHTALGASVCGDTIVGQYLLDPAVANAVDGTTCPIEFNPFELPAAGAGETELKVEVRTRLMAQIAYRPR